MSSELLDKIKRLRVHLDSQKAIKVGLRMQKDKLNKELNKMGFTALSELQEAIERLEIEIIQIEKEKASIMKKLDSIMSIVEDKNGED